MKQMNFNDPPPARRKYLKEYKKIDDEIKTWWAMRQFLKEKNVPYREIPEDKQFAKIYYEVHEDTGESESKESMRDNTAM